MPILQEGSDGKLMITVSKKIAEAKRWKRGDVLDYGIVDQFNRANDGDILLRKVR